MFFIIGNHHWKSSSSFVFTCHFHSKQVARFFMFVRSAFHHSTRVVKSISFNFHSFLSLLIISFQVVLGLPLPCLPSTSNSVHRFIQLLFLDQTNEVCCNVELLWHSSVIFIYKRVFASSALSQLQLYCIVFSYFNSVFKITINCKSDSYSQLFTPNNT